MTSISNSNITGKVDNKEDMPLYGLAIKAAMIYQAVTAAKTAMDIAKMNNKIAKDYYKIAKELHDYWQNTYKPSEIKLLSEVNNMEEYKPRYDDILGRAIADIKVQFGGLKRDLMRKADKYCMNLTVQAYKELAVQEAMLISFESNKAYRLEEEKAIKLKEMRLNYKKTMLDLGRNMMSSMLTGMSGAATVGNQAYLNASSNVSGALKYFEQDNRYEDSKRFINDMYEKQKADRGVMKREIQAEVIPSGNIGFQTPINLFSRNSIFGDI